MVHDRGFYHGFKKIIVVGAVVSFYGHRLQIRIL